MTSMRHHVPAGPLPPSVFCFTCSTYIYNMYMHFKTGSTKDEKTDLKIISYLGLRHKIFDHCMLERSALYDFSFHNHYKKVLINK